MSTTYTARNRATNQEQTFEEVHWISKIQPSGQWVLIRKNTTTAPIVSAKKAPIVSTKKGCGRCGSKK